jgi:Tfp pilus assembly protein PilN
VKRINYLVAPGERLFGDTLRSAASPRLRLAVVAIGGALASLVLPYCAESTRLHELESAASAYRTELADIAVDVGRVRGLERNIAKLRAVSDEVVAIRRSGGMRADEIAELGNALPSESWLTALRRDGEALEVQGGSARLSTVAATIAALARLSRYSGARLVSAYGGESRPQVSYSIVLERRR